GAVPLLEIDGAGGLPEHLRLDLQPAVQQDAVPARQGCLRLSGHVNNQYPHGEQHDNKTEHWRIIATSPAMRVAKVAAPLQCYAGSSVIRRCASTAGTPAPPPPPGRRCSGGSPPRAWW